MMTALHIVNRSPHQGDALATALALLTEGDALLLIEDAVIAASAGHPSAASIAACNCAVFALEADLSARGLTAASPVTSIDYSGFVELTVRHNTLRHWH